MLDTLVNVFRNISVPIILCENTVDLPVVYVNTKAKLLLNPQFSVSQWREETPHGLRQLLRFSQPGIFDDIINTINTVGAVDRYGAEVLNFEDKAAPVYLWLNLIEIEDSQYVLLFFNQRRGQDPTSERLSIDLLYQVFHAAYHSESMDEAIDRILRLAGSFVQVSRAYVFEEVSAETTRNTYEWCAEGTSPAIQDLQDLRKADYQYDSIVEGGVYVCNDIQDLPQADFQILDAQGIKALAIIPLYHLNRPLGYLGFDDCAAARTWSSLEINLLIQVADVLASLLIRRNIEEKAKRSFHVLQIISDNIDSIIYVNSLDSLELMFINKALASSLDQEPEALLGKPCWKMLQKGMTGQCGWCPIRKMVDEDGSILLDSYQWEFQNTITGKWYLVRDSIIDWVDGRPVHIETATEITHQKQYEQELERFASTDGLTGIYNREWGYKKMEELRLTPRNARRTISLCFIDLDGLKYTNDTYGHDAGDAMIRQIVDVIRSTTRHSDILFRWGGDEFILLLACNIHQAHLVMDHIQEMLTDINQSKSNPYHLGFSYGITDFNDADVTTVDAVITEADRRMYEQKLQKRRE